MPENVRRDVIARAQELHDENVARSAQLRQSTYYKPSQSGGLGAGGRPNDPSSPTVPTPGAAPVTDTTSTPAPNRFISCLREIGAAFGGPVPVQSPEEACSRRQAPNLSRPMVNLPRIFEHGKNSR
jgi:hypothetical protein